MPSLATAYHLINQRDYKNALIECNKYIGIPSLSPEAYFLKGAIYGEIIKYNESIACFHKSLQKNKNNRATYINIANIYFQTNNVNKSVVFLKIPEN